MTGKASVARWLFFTGVFMWAALNTPSACSASFEIVPGSLQVSTLDDEGNLDLRAGGHPDQLLLDFELNESGTAMRDLTFDFGPGLTGTPFATPLCPRAVFEDEQCPGDTQVGVFTMAFGNAHPTPMPLFNIVPTVNQIANLGFAPFFQTELGMHLRPSDYGLSVATTDMPQLPTRKGQVKLWGIPADHVGGSDRVPFLTSPTECAPLKVVIRARSWEPGATWVSETTESSPFEGCENLPFDPHLSMQLSDSTVDSPTGAQIDLNMTQNSAPDGQVNANLKEVEIDLPQGMTVSPGAVEGLAVCRDPEFGLGTDSRVACPLRSRVGTVEIATPQLTETVVGPVFLGEERPGERFRLFILAAGAGLRIKTLGRLTPDPQTGQLSAVLSDFPQAALSRISLTLGNGSVPLLATPLSCGPVSGHARFFAYGPHVPVNSSTGFEIAGGGATCNPLPFSPDVAAGSTQVKAGSDTRFSFSLTRRDGEQLMKKFSATFPAGLNANLTTIERCAVQAAASGICGTESRIGSALAEVGSGPFTALVRGQVYLTAPYRGAPFGLSIVFDATVGPFHLGSLNVRGVVRLDPQTGQLVLATDPLPTIFEGFALRFRAIDLDLDRPGFLRNPTSCVAKQIASSVTAIDGRATTVTNPFHVGGCAALKFHPRFRLALKGRGAPTPSNSDLSISVRSRSGDANIRQFEVKFPPLLAFHGRNVRAICAREDALEDLCPAASRTGTAIAYTPLLEEPLRGPVYLVQPKSDGFPDFWSSVEGMGVKMQLIAESSSRDGRLVTELTNLPDVPLSTFTMTLNGGNGGLFSVKGDPCGRNAPRRSRTPVTVQAQNGAYREMRTQLEARCATSDRKKGPAGRRTPRKQK